ncbi:MAG: Gfo/Idh/MocA family oxidoreductase, partial [Lentisphaerae bacterium]|nr:Gfo/Idh/MocA family oxidoreductase [Lentisphaerota bacterium]
MPADTKLKIAVAGLGRIGWNFHAKRIDASADFELAAVGDTVPERRAEAEDVFGCRSYADFATMIAEESLDAVVIATPTHLHLDMTLAAFEAGLDVLLEKPMASNLTEATEIVEAAEKLGRVLTVYQPHRLNAYFQHLKAIVDAGQIGRITQVLRGSFSYSRRNDWQSLQEYGGGMLNNYGAHFLDQVLQLIGYDTKRVVCDLQKVASLG